jgi:hypothetical protein
MNDRLNDSLELLAIDELTNVNGGAASGFVAGDSIGLGVAQQLHWAHDAKVGAPSSNIIDRVPVGEAVRHFMVISAGSNDPTNPRLGANLETMRKRAGGSVLWIAPVNPTARATVERVAHEHGDHVVTFTPGKDHVHPRSYAELGRAVTRFAH